MGATIAIVATLAAWASLLTQATPALSGGGFDPAGCTGAAFYVDKFYPDLAVDGATPNTFNVGGDICLTMVATYHWHGGAGAPQPGDIFVKGAGGSVIGSWQSAIEFGNYGPGFEHVPANWVATVNPPVLLAAGTYTVTDSDPATWSRSEASGGLGFIRVWGVDYVSAGGVASSGPPASGGGPSSTAGGIGPILIGGVLAALLVLILIWWLRRGGPAGGLALGSGVVSINDPCPPLIAAAEAAKAACDAAMAAAAAAAAAAQRAAGTADAARQALQKARSGREAAERELEKRQKPPDPGQRLGSTSSGGRDVHVDEYDLHLQAQARDAANAAHDDALAHATTDAERQQAHDDWANELGKIDGPDGLDYVRANDRAGREQWVKDAHAALDAARSAESSAQAEADRTAAAAKAAQDAAAQAKATADEACARAATAAGAAADCIKIATPASPVGGTPPPGGGAPPPIGPGPLPPGGGGSGTPPGTTPGTTPGTAPGGGTPPKTTERPKDCPDDAPPRVTSGAPTEVELYILSKAHLKVGGAYLTGDQEAQDAIDGLNNAATVGAIGTGLIGAVTDPVGSILGTLGVPSFDTTTDAPAQAARDALQKLNDQLKNRRQIGEWILSCPLERFRFYCRTTTECRNGSWVVTAREFVWERIGVARWSDSPPYDMVDPTRESQQAWTKMSNYFLNRNRQAQQAIEAAQKACAG